MPFSEGQTIIRPFHGPVRVDQIRERTVRGKTARYLNLVAVNNALTISIPVDRADETGLRAVASAGRVASLLDLLAAPSPENHLQWSRRVKDYQDRLTIGNIEELCYLVREISRSGIKAPATTEGQILRAARSTLAKELSLALKIDYDAAIRIIDSTVRAGSPA